MKNKVISKEYVEKNYISIKDLKRVLDIEDYDNVDILSLISTLMSEVDRLEDIEDRKVKIECQLIFDKGVKSVEDRIREKIDLIDKEYAEFIQENKNDLYLVNINAQRHSAMQSILEELLEE